MSALLTDKIAVIYGGGGAIGGASARVFAREGAQVYLAGRTRSKLDAVARDIHVAGGRAAVTVLDVFDEAAVRAHADDVAARTGGIDVMLNAILIPHMQGKEFLDTTLAEFEEPITATARSLFIPAQAVARHMVKRGGVIVSLTTPGGRWAGKGFLANGVFSAATEAFSRLLAAELGHSKVRCVCLRPDALPDAVALSGAREVFENASQNIGTPLQELLAERGRTATLLGRLPTLAEVAEFAAFVASDRATATTGAVININCGSITD